MAERLFLKISVDSPFLLLVKHHLPCLPFYLLFFSNFVHMYSWLSTVSFDIKMSIDIKMACLFFISNWKNAMACLFFILAWCNDTLLKLELIKLFHLRNKNMKPKLLILQYNTVLLLNMILFIVIYWEVCVREITLYKVHCLYTFRYSPTLTNAWQFAGLSVFLK